jgi:hypothetical protein
MRGSKPTSRSEGPVPEQGSRWLSDLADLNDPAGHSPGGLLYATPSAMAAAGLFAPAAKIDTSCTHK